MNFILCPVCKNSNCNNSSRHKIRVFFLLFQIIEHRDLKQCYKWKLALIAPLFSESIFPLRFLPNRVIFPCLAVSHWFSRRPIHYAASNESGFICSPCNSYSFLKQKRRLILMTNRPEIAILFNNVSFSTQKNYYLNIKNSVSASILHILQLMVC